VRPRIPALTLPAALAVLLLIAGCGSGGADAAAPSSPVEDGGLTGTLTVFAAASLTDVFPDLGDDLMADNPDLDVRFNFAGSSALATQIVEGAPADVFASANEPQMAVVTDADLAASEPEIFTSNVLQIAVPAGNPVGIAGLDDFARDELALALCSPEVPCGSAAEDVFATAGITPRPDTLEEDVRAALTKVELGEVDAALVYASDVVSAGDAVEGVEFPQAEDVVNRYPVCVLAEGPNPEAAEAFVELVLSEEGHQVLEDAGFRAP
jgi:molybdate transport system substrate-binding protein